MHRITTAAACGLLVACFVGCKSPAPPVSDESAVSTSPGEPKWVSKGAAAFAEEASQSLYGVGVAAANRFPADPFMLRKTAEERGRQEIAAQLQALVAAVFKGYAAAAFAPGVKPEEMQRLIENAQSAVADATLDGAKVSDLWKDPQTGALYALMKLSLDDVAPQLRARIIASEEGKLKLDPAAAHKELDRIIQEARKPR